MNTVNETSKLLTDSELDAVSGGLQGLGRIGPPLMPDANPAIGAWNALPKSFGLFP